MHANPKCSALSQEAVLIRSYATHARAQSFSRRGNKGKGKTTVGGGNTTSSGIGGAAAGEKADKVEAAAVGGSSGAVDESDAYADTDKPGLAKPEFKLAGQADPLRESIQQEAVALYEAGAYDDAGERFYYLAEAARNAGDVLQECTALQNMGTSLVMMSLFLEALRCYEKALALAPTAQARGDVLECLIWVHSERGDIGRAIEAVRALREFHEEAETPDAEALCSDDLQEGSLFAQVREFAESRKAFESALAIAKSSMGGHPNQPKWEGRAASELAQICIHLGERERGLALYHAALQVATDAGDSDKSMRAHANIAIVHKLARNLAGAVEHYDHAVAIAHKSEDVFMEGRSALDAAAVLHLAGEYDKALLRANRAAEIAEALDDDEARGECGTRIAEIMLSQGNASGAVEKLVASMAVWQGLCDECHSARLGRLGAEEEEEEGGDDPERVEIMDEHADTTQLLVQALSIAPGGASTANPVPPLLASEAGRCVALRSLIALDGVREGAPLHVAQFSLDKGCPALSSPDELTALLAQLHPEGPGSGAILYYTLLESDFIRSREVYEAAAPAAGDSEDAIAAMAPAAAEAAAADAAASVPHRLCVWLIDHTGVRAMHTCDTVGSDGRSLEQLCADLTTKLTLCFDGTTTRGPPINAEVAQARREELAARGISTETDAHGRVDVSCELARLSELLLPRHALEAHLPADGATLTIIPHHILHGVPFCALPHPAAMAPPSDAPISAATAAAASKTLGDAYPIAYAPSLTVLGQLATRAKAAAALVDDDETAPHQPLPAIVVGGATTARSFELPPLPCTAPEAAAVAGVLGVPAAPEKAAEEAADGPVRGWLLSGAHAEARIVGSLLARGVPLRCLHLACHSRPNCLALGKTRYEASPSATGDSSDMGQGEAGEGGAAVAAVVAGDATSGKDAAKAAAPAPSGGGGGGLAAKARELAAAKAKAKQAEEEANAELLLVTDEADDAGAKAVAAQAQAEAAEVALQRELEEESEAAAQEGPIANGLLTMEVLAQLPLGGYPTVVLTGSHAAVGQVSQDYVLGIRRALLVGGAKSVVACAWDAADEAAAILAEAFYKALVRTNPKSTPVSQAKALQLAMQEVRKAAGGKYDHVAFYAGFSVVGAAHGI